MAISEVYNRITQELFKNEEELKSQEASIENLKGHIELLNLKKETLEIIQGGKVVDPQGIGSVLDFVMFFDREGYSAIPREFVRDTHFVERSELKLNIVPLSELMTVPCPECGAEVPYMQRIINYGLYVTGGKLKYVSCVAHCGDLRKVEHEFLEKKLK